MEVRGEAEAGKFLTCGALSLGKRFILSLVLVHTDTFVHCAAARLIDSLTLLPGGGLAQSLGHRVANLLVVGHTLRLLLLLILGVPHHGVLRPAGHGLGLRGGLRLIVGSSGHQTH